MNQEPSELDEIELWGGITSPDGDGAFGTVQLSASAKQAIQSLIDRKVAEELERINKEAIQYNYTGKEYENAVDDRIQQLTGGKDE